MEILDNARIEEKGLSSDQPRMRKNKSTLWISLKIPSTPWGVGSMPPQDQAGLYSPGSTSGASPDCSRIQPLCSHHAAWSHERGRKGANTECG